MYIIFVIIDFIIKLSYVINNIFMNVNCIFIDFSSKDNCINVIYNSDIVINVFMNMIDKNVVCCLNFRFI